MALALDGSTPAYAADSADPWVTASFTPPNDALLVATVTGDWFGGTPTFTFTDSQGVLNTARWTSAARYGSLNNGVVEIFTAQMSSSEGGVSRTIQCDSSLAAGPGGVKVLVFTGAAAIGPVDVVAGATGGFTDPVNVNVVTTRNDTWVVGGAVDWDGDGNFTSSDTVESFSIGGTLDTAFFRKGSARATPGTETVNINPAGAATGGCYGFVGITSTDAQVAVRSQGAAVAGTTSITTAAYGAGWQEGDLAVCVVASNHATVEATEPTVSGFDKIGTLNGGGGAQGTGTGNRRLTYFTRTTAAGDDTTPTVSLSTGNVMIAAITIVQKAAGLAWESPVAVSAFGAEVTAGTSWSQVMTSDPGFEAADLMLAACAVRDTSNSTSEGFSATGATFSTLVERIDLSSETGNDIALHVASSTVLTGPSSAAGTRTATHSTSESGVAGVLRIRAVSSGPNEGDASGAVGWAGSVTGKKFPVGAVSGTVGWAGTVTGAHPQYGAADGAVGWAGSATGITTRSGAASGAVGWGGSATGARASVGAASGAVGWAGSVDGARLSVGSAAGAVDWGGSATGQMPVTAAEGEATGAVSWDGSATGARQSVGSGAGAVGWAGTVTGLAPGAASGSVTWAGTVTGARPSVGSSAGAVGWAGSTTGVRAPVGDVTGAVDWAGSVTGTTTRSGAAAGAVDWAGSAAGARASVGSATGAVGWAGTVTGSEPDHGEASGAVTWGAGTAAGARMSVGAAAGAVDWDGTATGAAPAFGTPVGLTVTPVSSSQLDLDWDAVFGAGGYDIERDGVVIVSDHPTNSYSDQGLDPSTEYCYRVRAVAA